MRLLTSIEASRVYLSEDNDGGEHEHDDEQFLVISAPYRQIPLV
jgi:hypothetical protein